MDGIQAREGSAARAKALTVARFVRNATPRMLTAPRAATAAWLPAGAAEIVHGACCMYWMPCSRTGATWAPAQAHTAVSALFAICVLFAGSVLLAISALFAIGDLFTIRFLLLSAFCLL